MDKKIDILIQYLKSIGVTNISIHDIKTYKISWFQKIVRALRPESSKDI